MDLGQVDVLDIIAVIIVPDLCAGPVYAFDAEDLARFHRCEGRDVGATKRALSVGPTRWRRDLTANGYANPVPKRTVRSSRLKMRH